MATAKKEALQRVSDLAKKLNDAARKTTQLQDAFKKADNGAIVNNLREQDIVEGEEKSDSDDSSEDTTVVDNKEFTATLETAIGVDAPSSEGFATALLNVKVLKKLIKHDKVGITIDLATDLLEKHDSFESSVMQKLKDKVAKYGEKTLGDTIALADVKRDISGLKGAIKTAKRNLVKSDSEQMEIAQALLDIAERKKKRVETVMAQLKNKSLEEQEKALDSIGGSQTTFAYKRARAELEDNMFTAQMQKQLRQAIREARKAGASPAQVELSTNGVHVQHSTRKTKGVYPQHANNLIPVLTQMLAAKKRDTFVVWVGRTVGLMSATQYKAATHLLPCAKFEGPLTEDDAFKVWEQNMAHATVIDDCGSRCLGTYSAYS